MGRKYKNPPILEAVCEFRFVDETEWDATIPGLLYEKVRNEYPEKTQRSMQSIVMSKKQNGLYQEVNIDERILFVTKDRKRSVQTGTRLLAINCLKPYPTWQAFQPKIEQILGALSEIVALQGVQRIGLRYVNRIEIPQPNIQLQEFFGVTPLLEKDLPQKMASFVLGCTLPFNEDRDLCKVTLSSARPDKPNNSALVLDIDYYLTQPRAVMIAEALSWVSVAHQSVEEIFEGCIKDPLRELFQEVKQDG